MHYPGNVRDIHFRVWLFLFQLHRGCHRYLIAVASGYFVYSYLLAIAFRALDFGGHFMLKYSGDCF